MLPPVHVQPETGPVQFPLHLSTDETSPSSHISPYTFFPSPQIGVQTAGIELVQVQPVSIVHVDEHPSRSNVFPSSQDSETVQFPSPQSSTQTLGLLKSPPEQ